MEDFGLVSIITPCYNGGKFIGQMIESVQKQTYTNWELLITDDCSTDNSCDIILSYAKTDSRIKLFKLPHNSGAGVARNNSIEKACGAFIAFLDSDDFWMSSKLEKQLSFMLNGDYALTYTSYLTCNEDGDVTGIVIAPKKHTFFNNKCDDKVGFSTSIYSVTKLGKRFMPIIRKRQDWGLVLSILKDCRVSYGLKEPLSYYRKGQDSLSKNKYSLIKYNVAAYQSVLNWPYWYATIFFWLVYVPCNLCKKMEQKYINR